MSNIEKIKAEIEDLEEEIKNYFEGLWPGTETAEQCNTDLHFTPPAIIRLARHFAEWQAEKCDEETSKLLYAERQTAYINGWDDHKEQMMKDAVEGTLGYGPHLQRPIVMLEQVPDIWDGGCKSVKVIVIKEDEKL